MAERMLETRRPFSFKEFFLQWEWLLVLLFIIVNIVNANLSSYYLNSAGLWDATTSFLDEAFIVLPMVFVMILGEIDISVGSIVALSSVVMAEVYHMGVPMALALVICLLVGTLCGWINGLVLVKFKELSSVIVTLSTMILFRGIAYILLKDQALGDFPAWFNYFGWGDIGGIPFIFIAFAVCAIFYGLLLHQTTFGRRVYAIGNNETASRFSGVKVDRIKWIVFTLAGLMSAITAIFLTSKMGSTRPNIANGYELDVIAMVALGGISTSGGKGRMIGAIIAVFLVGLLKYGLGLINVPSEVMLVIVGFLLIFAVAISQIRRK